MNYKVVTILSTMIIWSTTATICHAGNRSEIKQVIQSCPLDPTNCEPGLVISDIKVFGTYAKASVRSSKGPGETDTAYLHKEKGRWVLLDQGTGVDPEALGVPKKAW